MNDTSVGAFDLVLSENNMYDLFVGSFVSRVAVSVTYPRTIVIAVTVQVSRLE